MPRLVIQFGLLVFIATAVVGCEANSKLPDKTERPKRQINAESQALECIPDSLAQGDILTLVMRSPHGGDLAIVDPQGRYFYLSNSRAHDEGGMSPEMDSEVFRQLDHHTIDTSELRAIPFVYDATEKEIVFDQPGEYQVRMGENLETTGAVPVYTCTVYFGI